MIEPIYVVIVGGIIGFIILTIFLSVSKVWPLFVYAYSNARLSAMEVRLLTLSRMREIASQKSVKSAIEALSNSDYSKMDNVEICSKNPQMAFDQYLVDHIVEVQKFSPKITMPLFNYYLREWEIRNLLSLMHIVINKIPVDKDDAVKYFVDAGALGHDKMKEIVFTNDVALAIEKLKDTEYYPVIDGYFKKYGGNNTGMLDAMLDKYNIVKLHDDAARGVLGGDMMRLFGGKKSAVDHNMNKADSFVIHNYARTRADILNIIVAMRLILSKADADEYREQFIPFGLFISPEKLKAMMSAEKIENMGVIMAETPYEETFKNGLNEFLKTGKIDGIARRLDDYLVGHVKAMARENQFSIAVMLRYMALKRNEVMMLGSIFKGITDSVRFEIDDDMRIVMENR
ncbi:MAG: V-type ATPase subunit [archaeon]